MLWMRLVQAAAYWGFIEDSSGATDFGENILRQCLPAATFCTIVVMFDVLEDRFLDLAAL